jgi:hypothetical protein
MNPMEFFEKHEGKHVRVVMRTDSSSHHIDPIIEGVLLYFDPRSGLLIVNHDDAHIVLDNRGSRSYWIIERGGNKK